MNCRQIIEMDPNAEVIPGVRWGSTAWVPSPAWWRMMALVDADADNYVAEPGTSLNEVLAFCLLGGHGIRMESNEAAWSAVREAGLLVEGRRPDSGELEQVLRRPMDVDGRMQRFRFPAAKARLLAGALQAIEDASPLRTTSRETRDALMAVKGIGPKTASWIVRNWLGADDVAIIDVHVHRVGLHLGLFAKSWKLPRDYGRMESRFLDFAVGLGIPASLLDATIWREARIMHDYYGAAN